MTTADRRLDLVCFSYLADAQVLHVDTYPPANSGPVVAQTSASIAADGPLTAALASQLGLQVGLIANPVGNDPAGHRILAWLERARISHRIARTDTIATPQLTVIADADTRTWFAATQHVTAGLLAADLGLLAADLGLLTDARLVYVDCYQLLATAATRVVAAATHTPLLLNLGGDPLDEQLARQARNRRIWAVQTSLDEDRADDAEALAEELFARVQPDTVVVTLGRLGALALTPEHVHRVPAPPAPTITHTHGAGAAFSAGYLHALLTDADAPTALRAGCAAGTAHCAGRSAVVPRQLPAETFA